MEIYEKFLGESLNYSFSSVEDVMSDLHLREGDHVLEVGGGSRDLNL